MARAVPNTRSAWLLGYEVWTASSKLLQDESRAKYDLDCFEASVVVASEFERARQLAEHSDEPFDFDDGFEPGNASRLSNALSPQRLWGKQ